MLDREPEEAEATGGPTVGEERVAIWIAGSVLALSLVIRAAWWFRRAYNHDDFYFAYLTWIRSTGAVPGRDFWVPNFAAFAELWSPVARIAPESFLVLDGARALLLVVSALLLFAVYRLSRVLTGSVSWALAIAAVVSLEPDFMQRIGDVRGDSIAALCLISAVGMIASESRLSRLVLAAFVTGVAVVFATKLVYALPFVVVGAALASTRGRLRGAAASAVAAGAPPALYLGWRVGADGWPVVNSLIQQVRYAVDSASDPGATASALVRRDLPLWAAVSVAALLTLSGSFRRERPRLFWYTVLAGAFLVVFLAVNPFNYPYNYVILAPVAAPMLAGFIRVPRNTVVATAMVLLALVNGLGGTRRMLNQSNSEQRRLIEWVWSATAPDETVFDWQGLHFGRHGVPHWYTFGAVTPRYAAGWYSLAREWSQTGVTLMIPNYRFQWLSPRDRAFLQGHYISAGGCALVPGTALGSTDFAGSTARLEIVVAGQYRLLPAGLEAAIDGVAFTGPVFLRPGQHRLTVGGAPPAGAYVVFTTRRREAAGPPPCPAGPLLFGF